MVNENVNPMKMSSNQQSATVNGRNARKSESKRRRKNEEENYCMLRSRVFCLLPFYALKKILPYPNAHSAAWIGRNLPTAGSSSNMTGIPGILQSSLCGRRSCCQIDQTPKAIKVGDYQTKKLIDAERAVWVIGGDKMGVMTKRAKWAFEKQEDAEKFVKESGGKISTFDEAIKSAYEDMYADTKMIRERRRAKRMGAGSGS
jgi:hypothetical protein